MSDVSSIRTGLLATLERQLPRVFSQISRDPNAPFYGCCDRNWHHYKIRDFPSIILQQAGYFVASAAEIDELQSRKSAYREIARASAIFWNQRAVLHGAFEEYYPYEQGYPPVAFSTLAMAKLAYHGIIQTRAIYPGLKKAAGQLLSRFEPKAANQQVAGLAALECIRRIVPELVPANSLTSVRQRTLALQNEEGWYQEYGGPDLGYLAVTIDCLWDAYDASNEEAYLNSARTCLHFIASLVAPFRRSIGMHNARNTDYLTPYGIVRFLNAEQEEDRSAAAFTVNAVFADADRPDHFFAAIDDRYWCHYTGHSVARAVQLLEDPERQKALEKARPQPSQEVDYESCGTWYRPETEGQPGLLLSRRKGGILTLGHGQEFATDYGWVVEVNDGLQFVSHWWSDRWTWEMNPGEGVLARIEGHLFPHSETVVTPVKHMALRVLSFIFGYRLIDRLKARMIFKAEVSSIRFRREIREISGSIEIYDQLENLPVGAEVKVAPRISKRHVASADSHHPEDFPELLGCQAKRETNRNGNRFEATIRYHRPAV